MQYLQAYLSKKAFKIIDLEGFLNLSAPYSIKLEPFARGFKAFKRYTIANFVR